jgi:serine-type D-Ala-D-Ala carboxypeptidase/endopeptidase
MSRCTLIVAFTLITTQAHADHSADVEKLVQPLLDSKSIVGCVVGVLDNGKQEVYGFGEIHRGSADKPDGNTVYEIGSMSKAFTGTLLGDLVNRRVVKLDAPLQDFLPKGVKLDVAEGQPIKLVDLASQSSGLPRLPDNMPFKDPANPYADYTPKLLFEFLGKHKLQRPPGTYEYSNLGMGLLGYVLAQKEKKTYEQLVVERICDPLKMGDTRIRLSADQKKRLAPPYDAGLMRAKNWDINVLAGAGGLRSTVNDLLKFAGATLAEDDRPVVKAVKEAWKPHYGKPGDIRVGLAWHQARDGATWWHNGQTGGYSSALFVFPPKKLAVVVLCNTATDLTTPLDEKILQTMLGLKPESVAVKKVVEVDPAVLKSYEGMYALSLAFAITITLEDGKLMAQATNQDKNQIFPESDTKFFYKVVDAQITFEKGDDGTVRKLILHQNGQAMPGIKVPTGETAPKASEK